MPPNANNEITLAITEDRVGEFFHARKFNGYGGTNNFNSNDCPKHDNAAMMGSGNLQNMFDFGTPQYPSDFNLYSCCDFTFLKEGNNIKRLFKSDAHCNQSNYQDGYTSDYPYEESPLTLCVSHAAGDHDQVINPVCDIWRGDYSPDEPSPEKSRANIECRVGHPVRFVPSTPTNIYGMRYKIPIATTDNMKKRTLKVVACAYRSTHPEAQIRSDNMQQEKSVVMTMSPILSMTYSARQIENACKNTDTTKCTENACLRGGLMNIASDTSRQITAKDCTTFDIITETDNPAFPFCERDSDCPSKSCKSATYVEYLPFNESEVNETLVQEIGAINCSYNASTGVTHSKSGNITQIGCPGGGVCRDTSLIFS